MQSSLVYICKVDTPDIIEYHPHYIDITKNTFKDRFYEHEHSIKCESKRNATELSNFVWKKKHAYTEMNLVWNVLEKARAYKPEAIRCMLCLTEKYIIFFKLNLLIKISFTFLTLKITSRRNMIDFNSLINFLSNVSRISCIIFFVIVYFTSSEDPYVVR